MCSFTKIRWKPRQSWARNAKQASILWGQQQRWLGLAGGIPKLPSVCASHGVQLHCLHFCDQVAKWFFASVACTWPVVPTAHPFPPWSWPAPSAMLRQQPQPGQCRHVVSIAQNKTPALSLSWNRRHFSLLVKAFFTESSIFLPRTLRPAEFMLIFNY